MVVPWPALESAAPAAAGPERAGAGGGAQARGEPAPAPVPPVLTGASVLGEARLGNQLQLTVAPAPAPALLPRLDAPAEVYEPLPGDRLFTVRGPEPELPLYFARLQTHLAEQGRQVEMQWTEPGALWPTHELQAAGRLRRIEAGEEATGGAEATVLLVLRTQPGR
jgi:hypothetical protein